MNHRIEYLFNKYKQGQLSEGEELEWQELLDQKSNRAVLERLLDEEWSGLEIDSSTSKEEKGHSAAIAFILNFPQRQRRVFRINTYYWAAALALFCCAVTVWIYLFKSDAQVLPGTNKAYITLADGKKIELSDNAEGIEVINGEMHYSDDTPLQLGEQTVKATDFTLVTPRGGQYKVKLPDGTLVFLNASSSLTYPSSFEGKGQRIVQLKGEGYFEVAKDAEKPFIVQTDDETVRVLGTKFLVSNYQEEALSKTTLLEGAVVLEGEKDKVFLKPNEQAVWAKGKLVNVHQVNALEEMAWINGEFVFDNMTLADILSKLSRWYDVDINYELESLKSERYEGVVNRFDDIGQVLTLLELANDQVRFELKGRTIQVIKNR